MIGLVNLLNLCAVLIFAAAQLTAGQSVTGVVRGPGGRPAPGVRIMAMVAPGAGRLASDTAVLASLTETDKDGRYRLEDIPPGRYFIAAGLVDAPTFYPGTLLQNEARVVTIAKDGPAISGIDFVNFVAANPPPGSTYACCNLSGLVLTEDGRPLPVLPLKVVDPAIKLSVPVQDEFFRFFLQPGTTAQLAVDGLPPGYSLESIIYGGKAAGPTLLIDRRYPQSLLLIIRIQPGSTLPTVTARGKIVNIARELSAASSSLVLTPTISSGTTVVTPIQPDYSFEISNIPIGSYRTGIRDKAGNVWASSTVAMIRSAASDLNIDFGDNPFPDLNVASVSRDLFTGGKETTITGVATQRLTHLRGSSSDTYFRMSVKDEPTGVVTPWAIYVGDSRLVPNIATGQTYTVTGTTARDGTNRLHAQPF